LGISSSPAISGNLVIVGSKDGYLHAADLTTGQPKWKVRVGEVTTASPLSGDGVVYIQSGGTRALDLATGKILWRAGLGGSVQSVPVVSGKSVYLASNDGEFYALE
jgi:outer membrane protein assembly factor BamB